MFRNFINYCSANNVFDNYEDALKGYQKHCQRQSLQEGVDPLKDFSEKYHNFVKAYFRKKRQHTACKFYTYEFNDVKSFLCKHHYWGMQVFDSHSNEPTECVYSKDGVVICFSSWGYIDVIGLRPCDFYLLEKAYEKAHSFYLEED